MSAGPQLSSFLRPTSKLPPVGGACQWGCTKTVPVLDSSVTERAVSAGDGPERRRTCEWRKLLFEPPDQLGPRLENPRVQFRFGLRQPGGEKLVLVAQSE